MGRRIKDFEYTASAFSPDDYIAIDGETQGTRNMQYSTLVAEMSAAIGGGGGTTEVIGDKCIFVDVENGLDTNSGLTEAEPVATVSQAYALMESRDFDTFCIIGTEPNDPQANPIEVAIPTVPDTLQINTLNIVTKVSSQLTFASINTALNINAKSSVLKVVYGGTVTSNINITSDGNVETHNIEDDVESITSNLKINAKGNVFLNCIPYEYNEYGLYLDSSADYELYTLSVNVKANNIYACGRVKNGCDITFIADNDVYNHFELSYDDTRAIEESDSNWANVTQNYYFEAGNSVCQLADVIANAFIVKSKYYGYRNGSSLVTGSLTVKSKVDIRTTNDTYIGFINIGDITERGHVYIAGGFEQCVSDKALFDQQGKSLNNPILQINGIISHYGITAKRNLHEYAPVVFINWKGLIEHNGTTIYAQQYKEKSLGYTTMSDLAGLYISGLDYFHDVDGVDTPIYHNYPVEIYSEGTLHNLKIYTGIDDASQKWIPVHIKCKNLDADHIEICSHDIVIDVEDSIITSSQATYFLPKPGNYYETDNGYIASYIDTDTDTESNVIVRAKRNITFIPPTLHEDYTCNQVFTVEAGEEVRLNNFGNFGTRICAKIINIKASKLSGNFDNFCAEFHVDVDVFETIGSYFKVYGYLGENDKWAHLGTTQSTFNAKTVIMLNDTTEDKPISGIFEFGMISSNPTEVRNLDIHIGIIVCSFNWTTGIYCPLLRHCSDYNGEISGEIGMIVNTYNGKIHKITRWQKDLIFYQPDNITSWNTSARVSLHFTDRSSPSDIFVDPDQGDDRFDGLTASRPVKTVVGFYRALKAQGYITIDNSNHYVKIDKPISLHMLSGSSNSNRGSDSIPSSSDNYSLQLYVNRGMTGDTDLQESYVYEFWFNSDLEIIPEAPNLRVSFMYLNSNDKIIEARGFESFYVDGYTGSVLIVEAANTIRINNDNMAGPAGTIYWQRWNGGYNTFKSRAIELRGRFYNIVADADYQFSIYDTTSGTSWSLDNCCMSGYTNIHSAYYIYLGDSNSPVGINGIGSIRSDLYISAYLDTILGELNMDSGSVITGSIGSSFMISRLRMRSKSITFYSKSFVGTTNMGNLSEYPGNYIDIEAEQSIDSSELSSILFFRSDVNIKTKYFNSPELVLYGDQNSKSIIEAEVITPTISYRLGSVTIKATRASNIVNRLQGGPISVSRSYAENLYLDINEFLGYIYLPYESSQYNYASNIFARVGTTYQPIVYWGFDPGLSAPAVSYNLGVTVEHSKYNPSGIATKKSNYGDTLPANASGEILILNDMDVEIPQPQVVNKTAVIPSGSTIAGVELENDNYNVIATLPASVTELDVNFPESTNKVQESGFQFDVEANSQLALVKAFVAGRQIPVKAPSVFDSTKMYQGTSLHNAVVIAEFDIYPITITNIEATNDTSSSIDIDVTGTMGSDPLPNNLEYTLSLSLDGVITNINAIGPTTMLTGTNFTNYSNATDVAAIVTIGGKSYTAFTLKGNPLILDGRLYKTVTIGNQTWMAENLDYKFNGLQLNNSSWSYDIKQADYYDKDEATYGVNGNKYGLLYNFIATKYLNDNKSTLIPGWHVPTLEEWNTLIEYAGGSNVAGSKLKSTTDWTSGPPGADGTDEYGFNAKPAGYGSDNDNAVTFTGVGTVTYFLTSTPISEGNFNPCNLIGMYNSSAAASLNTGFGNDRPFSIRLIKNDPYNPLDLPSNTIRVKYRSGTQPTLTNSNATVTQVDSSTNTYDVTLNDTYWSTLFINQTNLVEVLGANTSSVTSMAALFNGCSNLTTVAAFNTSKVTDMNYMFYKCNYLTSIQKIDTSRVTNMSYMFAKCTSLTTVPEFNTSSVTNMEQMFAECSAITTVPTFNTQNVTNMNSMFAVCSSLTSVPLFDTSNVTNMQSMFNSCTRVESGALALYQRASTQTNVPSSHSDAFYNCGSNTTAGSKELSQIATDWGGVLIIDGKRYGITKIGNQEWMTDNLDYQIPNAQYNTGEARITTPAMWYFNLDASTYGRSGKNYGLLYNWFAAKYLNDNKETLIPGWRVPTKADFETLKATLNSNLDGKMLKSTTDWSNNGNGTDDYHFCAYPAGYRSESGMLFSWLGTSGRFWTTTVNSANDIPYLANLSSSSNALTIAEMNQSSTAEGCKCIAISLRLIRDV